MPVLSEKIAAPANNAKSAGLGPTGENLSIMIPNYNGAKYIGETLESLMIQGDSIRDAQIMVLDNCSTDNSLEVVRTVWGDRVTVFQHPENIGGGPNWNACLDMAERDWIHILHSDDMVVGGAYTEIDRCITECPEAIAVFGRNIFSDESGIWHNLSGHLRSGIRGLLPYEISQWLINPVQFVSVCVSREAFLTLGHFDCSLGSVLDWDYWWRLARTGRVAFTNHCLGVWRQHNGSWTSEIVKTGLQKKEILNQTHNMVAFTSQKTGVPKSQLGYLYSPVYYNICDACELCIGNNSAFASNFSVAIDALRHLKGPNKPLVTKKLILLYLSHFLRIYRQKE